MATDYLKQKWRVMYKSIDVDKDYFVTMKDADLFTERFIKLHKLDSEKARKVKQGVRDFWARSFYLDENREKITEEEYIAMTTELYNADVSKYRERIRCIMVDISNIYDVNQDGFLSTDELIVTTKCHGLEDFNPEYVLVFPEAKPGLVDMAVYRAAWVEFMTNPDPESNEIEKPCLISFNMVKRE